MCLWLLFEKHIAKDYFEYMVDCKNVLPCLTQSVLFVALFNTLIARLPQWDWVNGVFRSSTLNSYDLTVESFTGEYVIVGSFLGYLSLFWRDNRKTDSDLADDIKLSLKFRHT